MQQRHHQFHFWHFLKNKEMNEIYLAYGLDNFAMGLVSIFVPIYLFKLGYPVLMILLYYFLLPLNSVIFSTINARVIARVGVKYSILISAFFKIVFLVSLRLLPGHAWLFFILPTFNMLKTQYAALSYHLNFVEHSDSAHRGRQVGALHMAALAASIVAPLLGGVLIASFGFKVLFVLAISLIFVSIVPIFKLPHKDLGIKFNPKGIWKDMFKRENIPLFKSYGGYAVEEWIGFVVWSLFIFMVVNSTVKYGFISAFVSLVAFVVFYSIGKMTDKQDKGKLIRLANIFYFFGWVGRIFADSFSSVIFFDSYKNIAGNALQVPWAAYSYDLAAKHNYFRFIVQRDLMYDFTRIHVVPFIILIFWIGYHPFLISFIIAAVFSLGYMSINQAELKPIVSK